MVWSLSQIFQETEYFYSGGNDNKIKCWDFNSEKSVFTIDNKNKIHCIVFKKNGK